jgi:toluene monooxygenase system protein E
MATSKHTRPKTWSLLGDVQRKPTEYEVVSTKFLNHFRHTPAPFDLSPQTPINQWYLTYREGSPLQVDDWESFRDPNRMTYRKYVSHQHERETYLDILIDGHEAADSQRDLSQEWVATARDLVIPLRFPLHALQIATVYLAQMAPSSLIVNAAAFQAADEMRRIQRIAYWTKTLSLAHGEALAATETARTPWENGTAWQPLRRSLEELLAVRDWGETFAALNLVVKPALDTLINTCLAQLAARNGDEFLAALLTEFGHDGGRSRDWSVALANYAIERRPELRKILGSWISRWRPGATKAVTALSELFTAAPVPLPAPDVTASVTGQLDTIHQESGLRVSG